MGGDQAESQGKRRAARASRTGGTRASSATRALTSAVVDALADPLVIYDDEWHVVYVNARAAEAFQAFTRGEDPLGRVIWDLIPELRGSILEHEMRRAAATGAPVLFRTLLPWADAQVEVQLSPAQGALAAQWRDVTAQHRSTELLRDAEERFRLLADTVPAMIWMAGPTGLCEWCNQRWLTFTGRTLEQELGDGWLRGIHPDDVARVVASFTASLQHRRPFTSEYRLRRHDGEYRWVLDSGAPRYAADGSFAGNVGSCIDITDRREAEQRMMRSEALLQETQHGARIGSWEWELSTGVLVWSDEMYHVFALDPATDEVTPERFHRMVHPQDAARVRAAFAHALETGRAFGLDHLIVRDDGAVRWLHSRGRVLFDEQGNPVRMVGSAQDITERKRDEDAAAFLAEATSALASSLDYEETLGSVVRLIVPRLADWCAIDIIAHEPGPEPPVWRRFTVDHDDPARDAWAREVDRRYAVEGLEAPVGVRRVLRTGRAELYPVLADAQLVEAGTDDDQLRGIRELGLRSAMVIPLSARGRTLGTLTLLHAESGRQFDQRDFEFAQEFGHRAALAIDNARLFRENQEAREKLGIQAEELEGTAAELEAVNDELTRRAIEADAARADAESANRVKSEFLAMMSHELRTPLNAIGGYVEILELGIRGALTAPQREDLRRIRVNQQHLLGIITDVLNFARLESGRVRFDIADVNVDQALSRMHELIEPQVHAKALTYEYVPPIRPLAVRADADKLQQIVLNLLTNAVKYTPPGGTIALLAEADAEQVHIRVRDTGRGIARERQHVIFEPFVQAEHGLTRDQGGVGLGLAISRDLARAMGGDLAVESEVGEGATFTITLPRADGSR